MSFLNRESTKARLGEILSADKEEIEPATRIAALSDLKRVISEYFEPLDEPDFQIKKEKNSLSVTVSFHAVRVKNFTTLK